MAVSEFSLVRSKLLIPSPAGLLHRPRVCQAIGQGLEARLTLISAPAGYGKTSALVDFARHSPVPVCWYTADERDRDLRAFVEYLVGAIEERFQGFGQHTQSTLASMDGDLLRDSAGLAGAFVNELVEIDTPLVVVVDNYETLDGAFGIRTFVHRLLEVLPFNCHLMLGSRVLPDAPVTRLVAKRQLVGLTDRELRFTPQEIRELLQVSRIEVSEAQAEEIAANSEGWVTGVLLLADLLSEGAKTFLLDAGRATAETYGYLATDVLSRQPPDVQHFLTTTAVLREMSPRLCREILGIRESRGLLSEVKRRNLFVTRFGAGSAATYRYHNLFRDFLCEQLRQRDPVRYAELHMRAARRFEQDNDIEEAVYHYLAVEAYPDAAVLMERVAMEWFTRGWVETLLRWADALPEEVRVQVPRLSLYQSKVLTDRCGYGQARQALAYAEAGFADRGDTVLLTKVHMQRATLGLFEGRYEDVVVEAQAVLDVPGQSELAERAQAQRLIGRAYVGLGSLAEGVIELQEALALFRQVGSFYDVANLLQDLGTALVDLGRFDEAIVFVNEALGIGRRLGAPTQLAGVLNNLGWLHYARGEYERSLALYEEGLAAARRGGDLWNQAYISVGMADLYRDVGAYERAEPLYYAGWEIARENEPGLAVYILRAQADMYRWQGGHARALALLEQARQLAEANGLNLEGQGLLLVAEGITLAESGEVEAGLDLLSEGSRFLEQRHAKRELARVHFLLARAYFLAGNEALAVAELDRAVDLADEIGTYQFAVVEGQHAEGLLRLGITRGMTACSLIAERVRQLRAFGAAQIQGNGGAEEEDAVDRLEVYALGEGRVVRDGQAVSSSEWQAAMAKELFFYILLHGPQERDAIGAVFWPELSTKKMADSFHTTLYRIRRALGAEAVVMDEGQYCMGDIDYWFDVEAFETLVNRARLLPSHDWQTEDLWRRALALYRGDFLPEVERVWCVPRREALRGMYLEALIGVGQCYEARREFEDAIGWYKRALELDDLREDIHRRIMHCYVEAGRRPEALAQYHRCQEILQRELGVDPSIETQRLYEQIAGRELG